jgi:hypothetical protein
LWLSLAPQAVRLRLSLPLARLLWRLPEKSLPLARLLWRLPLRTSKCCTLDYYLLERLRPLATVVQRQLNLHHSHPSVKYF